MHRARRSNLELAGLDLRLAHREVDVLAAEVDDLEAPAVVGGCMLIAVI